MFNWNRGREQLTVLYNIKDHMAIIPVLSHVYSLTQSWVIPPYVRAVIFLSAIQYIEIPSLVI